MRTVFVVLLLLGGWLHGYAQKPTDLLPVKVNGKWGYINQQGATVITPQYDAAGYFDLQLNARVVKNGRVKLISYKDGILQELETGRVERYDDLKPILGNLVAYRIDKKWGLATWMGQHLLPCTFDAIEKQTYNGVQFVYCTKGDLVTVADANGEMITDTLFEAVIPGKKALAVKGSRGWGLINYKGDSLIDFRYTSVTEKDSNYWRLGGMGTIQVYSLISGRILKVNSDGDLTPVPGYPQYLYITSPEGIGILTTEGKQLLDPVYDYIKINDGFFYIYQNSKIGVYSGDGKKLFAPEFSQVERFDDHVALVRIEEKWGLINDKGQQIVEPKYNYVDVVGNSAKCKLGDDKIDVYELTNGGDIKDVAEYENVVTIRSYYRPNRIRSINSGQVPIVFTERGWYYDRWIKYWGYRDSNFTMQIEPKYKRVVDFPHLKMALVERVLPEPSRFRVGEADFTTRARYGIISTETYKFIYPPIFNFIDIEPMKSEDFKYTRAMMGDGKFVPLTRDGYRSKTRYTYIGKQVNGKSRYTVKGSFFRVRKLSRNKMKNPYGTVKELVDEISVKFTGDVYGWPNAFYNIIRVLDYSYTKYDDVLEIRDGEWGYLGDDGMPFIKPVYTMAFDFYKSSAIAIKGENYGVVDSLGLEKLSFGYKHIGYLKNSDSMLYEITALNPNYGLIDSLGNVIVPIKYTRIWPLQNNMVRYRDREKGYGYVNSDGKEIEHERLRTANDFLGEYACVKVGKRWNLMDQQGYMVKQFDYSNVGDFSEGLVAVYTNRRYGYVNAEGEMKIQPKYKKAYPFKNGIAIASKNGRKYGYLLPDGKWLVKPHFKSVEEFNASGYAIVRGRRGYGMIDKTGNMLLKPIYKNIQLGDDGMVSVQKGSNSFIYKTVTDELVPLGNIKLNPFKNGYAVYSAYGKYGIIDTAGNKITEAIYSECTNVTEGKYAARDVSELHIMNINGDTTYTCKYHRFNGDFNSGRLLVYHADSGYKYLSIYGENSFNRWFEKAEPFNNGVARVYYKDNWGLINSEGLELVDAKFSKIEEFKNGYAIAGIFYTKGVATNKGELLFQPDYEQVNFISNGVFRVEKGNEIGYISGVGKWIWGLQQ